MSKLLVYITRVGHNCTIKIGKIGERPELLFFFFSLFGFSSKNLNIFLEQLKLEPSICVITVWADFANKPNTN